jgi:hypothetical protein
LVFARGQRDVGIGSEGGAGEGLEVKREGQAPPLQTGARLRVRARSIPKSKLG